MKYAVMLALVPIDKKDEVFMPAGSRHAAMFDLDADTATKQEISADLSFMLRMHLKRNPL